MGRSVETVNDAEIIYFDCDNYEDYDWQDMITNVRDILIGHYPSLVEVEKWLSYPYRESKLILENNHIQISVSEYCGCGAFSVFVNSVNEDYWPYNTNIAEHWLKQNIAGIEKLIKSCVCSITRVGTFSNGEAIFTKDD
jgi:hypothetical protein